MTVTSPTTPQQIDNLLAAIQHLEERLNVMDRIENKLDAWKGTPEEVIQLRAEVKAMRAEEQQARESWRDAIYRTVTTLAGLLKPKERHP